MASNPSGTQTSRCQELTSSLPLVTLILLGVNIAVYVLANLMDFYEFTAATAVSAYAVLERGQVWRIVTSEFMHGGLLHIGFNMLTLYQFGVGLESMFGSLGFGAVMAVFILATGGMYVLLAAAAGYTIDMMYYFQPAIGFSGVLFAMAVDEAALSSQPSRSVFGLFNVPTRLYPWVLMIVLQLLIPNVSFIGHLGGALVGVIHSVNGFRWILPSLATLRRLEDAACFQSIRRLPSYKLLPLTPVLREDMSLAATCRDGAGCISNLLRPITDALGGIGRSRAPLASRMVSSSGRVDGSAVDVEAPSTESAPPARNPERYMAVPTSDADGSAPQAPSATAGAPSMSREEVAARAAAAAAARAAAASSRGIQSPKADAEPDASPVASSGRVIRDGVLLPRGER